MDDIAFYMVPGAPEPVAPFSHATVAGDWVFVTGQLPIVPGDEEAALPEGIEAQTKLTMQNLVTVLSHLELGLGHVVFARCYLTHFYDDYERFNEVYRTYFAQGSLPARTCIGVTGLARHARVEIDFLVKSSDSGRGAT